MTSTRETDYVHANERGNGPKARMEGGDATDDISINDPDSRLKEMRKIKVDESDGSAKIQGECFASDTQIKEK